MKEKLKKILVLAISALAVAGTVSAVTFAFLLNLEAFYDGKLAPTQYIADTNIGGLTLAEAEFIIQDAIDAKLLEEVTIMHEGDRYIKTLADLGVTFEAAAAEVYDKPTIDQILTDLINPRSLQITASIDLALDIPSLHKYKNAYIKRDQDGTLEVVEATEGVSVDKVKFISDLTTLINNKTLLGHEIKVDSVPSIPTVIANHLAPELEELEALIASNLTLKFEDIEVVYPLNTNPEFIKFEQGDEALRLAAKDNVFEAFVEETLRPEVERDPETITITSTTWGAEFSGIGAPGIEVNKDELRNLVATTLNEAFTVDNELSLDIPVIEIEPELEIDQALQDRGIKELLAEGYTTYYGSPANRTHNIAVGVSKFNGVIIPKALNYSFNTTLGEVEAHTGYLPELVITPDGTIPEYGGGLCQVSTTFFRAALEGGLDIVDRAPHSYAVSYYSQVGGHGLDATIYPPNRDLIVNNNTPADILVQSFVIGQQAYFRFYGTSDQREVELVGPYISNYRSAGSTQYVVNQSYATDQVKQVEKNHTGFDALWYREITDAEGNVTREPLESIYRAVPAKYIVAPDHEAVSSDS